MYFCTLKKLISQPDLEAWRDGDMKRLERDFNRASAPLRDAGALGDGRPLDLSKYQSILHQVGAHLSLRGWAPSPRSTVLFFGFAGGD